MPSRNLIAALLAVAAVLAGAAQAAATERDLHLSLGDSLAWGYSVDESGSVTGSPSDFTALLGERAGLRAHRLGCPGETTRSYRLGGRCRYRGFASQQAAARAFILAHRARIAFVTLTIGTGNLARCGRATTVEAACLAGVAGEIERDLGPILRSLRRAGGARLRIAVATLYDPFLALYLQGPEHEGPALATVAPIRKANRRIRAAARASRVRLAGVFGAFRTGRLEETMPYGERTVPVAVGLSCLVTYMCERPPVGPDLHANEAGHRRIAGAFARRLRLAG